MSEYQVMPELSPEEYAALKADITENGVLVPVVKDQHGTIIDGHHRARVGEELGITYRVDVLDVQGDEHARSLARKYNLARRHLSREQRRELIANEIEDAPDRSDREIARLMGCDHKTVGSVRRKLHGEVPQSPDSARAEPEQRIGFYRVHPFLACFPWVSDEEFAGIVGSIERLGLLQPIVLTHDRKTMVDGRIRYRACEAAGVEPRFRVLGSHYDELKILDLIWDLNVVRKGYTPEEKAAAEEQRQGVTA